MPQREAHRLMRVSSFHQGLTSTGLLRLFALLLGTACLLTTHTSAHAAVQRCLAHTDCPSDHQCLNRRCFKGLVGTVAGRNTGAYKMAVPQVRWFGPSSPYARRLQRAIWLQVSKNFQLLPQTFEVIPYKSYIERPPYNGVNLGTFYFAAWTKLKANGLIKIGLRKKGKRFTLMFRFYDVDESKMIVKRDVTISKSGYRWTVHQMCDKVYKYLTSKPGIFATMIAYVKRNPKGGKDIWVSDIDGANQRRVVSNGAINVLPRWSRDGQHLIFTSYLTGGANLYKLNLRTKQMVRLSNQSGTYTGATYAPNQKRIAFSMTKQGGNAASDIYVMSSAGGGIKRLTTAWGIDVSPSWSPDGKQLAFVSQRFSNPHIFLMNADGSSQTRLTFKGDYNQEPRWSPRGNEIMFTARDEFLQYDLFVIKLEKDASGQLKPTYRRLTQNQGTNLEASWSPDGRYILFISNRVGERKIYIMNLDGSVQKLFMRGWGNFATPAWSPLMKRPPLPGGSAGRSYFAGIRVYGVKKMPAGHYVPDDGNQPAAPASKKPVPRMVKAKVAAKPRAQPKATQSKPKAAKAAPKEKEAPKRRAPAPRQEPKAKPRNTPTKRPQPTKEKGSD